MEASATEGHKIMKSGYTIGAWQRIVKLYPYDTLPVGAYLIFEDAVVGKKVAAAAYRWGCRRGVRFKRKQFKAGYAIRRMT